jgi:hypothetical protein
MKPRFCRDSLAEKSHKLKKKVGKIWSKMVKKPKKCLNLLKTLNIMRPILQNKTMIPIFLVFSIKTSHKLVVGNVSDLLSPYFRKISGLNLLKIAKKAKSFCLKRLPKHLSKNEIANEK